MLYSYNLALEDQNGKPISFVSPEDKYALITGLVLHAAGQAKLEAMQYGEALETLTMGEEAFQLCTPAHLNMIDNAGLLQLDLVWCIFKLRDVARCGYENLGGPVIIGGPVIGYRLPSLYGVMCVCI